MTATTAPVRAQLSRNEQAALVALHEVFHHGEPWALTFKGTAARSGLPLHQVRRTVRALARKGMAQYMRGLMTEDGEVAGAGYVCTADGAAWVESQP
jgi:hypothetical protein